jgi:ADP-ribosyl-[dinitrogen reductase] hydrolase
MNTGPVPQRSLNDFIGCLLGGAIGDALGAPVEFMSLSQIRHSHGPAGVTDYVNLNHQGLAEFSDDTQMTLFTAEGLLIAREQADTGEIIDTVLPIHRAYLRWLETQQYHRRDAHGLAQEGWLLTLPEMWKIKAPGNTCLNALGSGKIGSVDQPLNDSKGCGGIMRAAPAGLMFAGDRAFAEGVKVAAITHGHPSGYLPAGCLAQIISEILRSVPAHRDPADALIEAVHTTLTILRSWSGCEETERSILSAIQLAKNTSAPVSPETVETLGGAWVGEEALAISLYCGLVFPDNFQSAVLLSINHSGDSDSTGAICGNLLGVLNGAGAIPPEWIEKIELHNEIVRISQKLFSISTQF